MIPSPKKLLLVCSLVLLSSVSSIGVFAQPSPEVPWDVKRNAVRATIRDYDSRLRAMLDVKLAQWSHEFVLKRASEIRSAAKHLARLASEIRDEKEISWVQVGKDEEFRKQVTIVVEDVLNPSRIKMELHQWAKSVEDDTRREMISCLAQIIAWDLGMKFDEDLRGKVQQAVRAIPVEQLVGDEVSREKLVEAIQAGLPGVILTDEQKEAISRAAGELARRGAGWLAETQLQLPKDWSVFLSGLAALGGAWAAKKGAEWIDRTLTGEPDPLRLAKAMDRAMGSWNERQISGRLKGILRSYRFQVLEFIQSEAKEAFRDTQLGPGR